MLREDKIAEYCANDVLVTRAVFDNARSIVLTPKKVIFNDPATIIFWKDGTKTVVKRDKKDPIDHEKAVAMCYLKKLFGNTGKYNDLLKRGISPASERIKI